MPIKVYRALRAPRGARGSHQARVEVLGTHARHA